MGLTLDETTAIGWIGLGSMGLPMAKNLQQHLLKSQRKLTFWNRSSGKGADLFALGSIEAGDVRQVIDKSEVIFLSLSNDEALEAVTNQVLATGQKENAENKVIVDTSTVHPDTTTKVAELFKEKGMTYVSAPVFGASFVAIEGKLLWALAGNQDVVRWVEPYIVGVMGRGIMNLGDEPSKATLLKTAGNFMTAGMMELIAESHVLAEKTGLGTEVMENFLDLNYGPMALSMSKRLTTGAYIPARGEKPFSDLKLAIKDVGHGVACAEKTGFDLKVGNMALGHLKEADEYSEREGRALDSSSLYGVLRRQAGLEFETEVVKERDARDS